MDEYAAIRGKQEVLKWLETKSLSIDTYWCARKAAYGGHVHILKWLHEEKGFELDGELYNDAIDGGNHLHVMKWLREQEVFCYGWLLREAACKGNPNILQWLHDAGCHWPEDNLVDERVLKPEVLDWCRVNGYTNRIVFRND